MLLGYSNISFNTFLGLVLGTDGVKFIEINSLNAINAFYLKCDRSKGNFLQFVFLKKTYCYDLKEMFFINVNMFLLYC